MLRDNLDGGLLQRVERGLAGIVPRRTRHDDARNGADESAHSGRGEIQKGWGLANTICHDFSPYRLACDTARPV